MYSVWEMVQIGSRESSVNIMGIVDWTVCMYVVYFFVPSIRADEVTDWIILM